MDIVLPAGERVKARFVAGDPKHISIGNPNADYLAPHDHFLFERGRDACGMRADGGVIVIIDQG